MGVICLQWNGNGDKLDQARKSLVESPVSTRFQKLEGQKKSFWV